MEYDYHVIESDYHVIDEMIIAVQAIPVILHGPVESSKVSRKEPRIKDTSIWRQRF